MEPTTFPVMRSMLGRRTVVVLLAGLVLAGCSSSEPAVSENGRPPEGGQASFSSGSSEHGAMQLPPQLDPHHATPPPAATNSPAAPSLPAETGPDQPKQFALKLANGLSDLFHDAASRVLPAVVTIRTISQGGDESDEDLGNPLGRFRGDDEEFHESLGSGVIIDASGVVLTNYHLVREKGETVVQLHDGRQFEIAATRADPHTDLAVLQLKNASGLPYAQLGDSDALKVGDWVLAVGNPFGLEATVTAGIISAKGRGLTASPREEFLQTDAPINPGNSGGPLVNLRGDVVGINTAISSTTGGYQGIGFTIPITLAKTVSRQLIENGKVRWAYLGVGVLKVTPDIAKQLGMDNASGIVVLQIRRDSPAAKAGIRPGDVIAKFDDKQISDPQQLQSALGSDTIGSEHSLTVIRKGTPRTVQVTIAEQPPERPTERPTSGGDELGNEGIRKIAQ